MKKMYAIFGILMIGMLLFTACGTTAAPTEAATTITLWHSYHAGGGEEAAINQLVADYQAAHSNVKVDVLAVPFDQIFNKYNTETAAGGGPDMITFPNDNLYQQVQDGLILDVTDKLQGKLGNVSEAGVAGMTVDGKYYGVPGIIKAVGVYYNKDTVTTPPATTDELMTAVQNGLRVGLISGIYFQFGWAGVFGG
ncbi:MAG: extracellular solute-binding protein, partial [Anaerolineaceae bacterium]